jgi:hypothetical protein
MVTCLTVIHRTPSLPSTDFLPSMIIPNTCQIPVSIMTLSLSRAVHGREVGRRNQLEVHLLGPANLHSSSLTSLGEAIKISKGRLVSL